MSFVMLPPEINSGRMYAGPGPGSLMAAAETWNNLSTELYSTAEHYRSVISGLTGGSWSGPSADRMAAAAGSHLQWLTATAGQAEQTGAHAAAAASAYSQAYAMTVPPNVIATNRAQYLMLVATNLFGQNAPAIGTIEAQYAEFWAQDAAAMDSYAVNSSTTTQHLSTQQFTPMLPTSDGGMAQTAAAASAQTQSAFAAGQAALPTLQQALSGIGSLITGPGVTLPPGVSYILQQVEALAGVFGSAVMLPVTNGAIWGASAGNWGVAFGTTNILASAKPTASIPPALKEPSPGLEFSDVMPSDLHDVLTSAGTGRASMVGGLAVPPNWADTAPALRLANAALPTTSIGAAAGGGLFGGAPLFGAAPLATVAGRGVGGSVSGNRRQPDARGSRASGNGKSGSF